MQPAGLHWFRRKQRTLSRVVLAAFCLTWLQLAAAPCVMALDSLSGMAALATIEPASSVASMPDGMVMAPGEHCQYCPPPQSEPGVDQAVCSFPHDPQVDLRVGLAAALLMPPPTHVLFVVADPVQSAADSINALVPAPASRTSLAVSFCRFLK
ncbi:MAG: hypothetical protein WBM03_18375 [Steroidobacteraceae bacterium]